MACNNPLNNSSSSCLICIRAGGAIGGQKKRENNLTNGKRHQVTPGTAIESKKLINEERQHWMRETMKLKPLLFNNVQL